MQCGALSLSTLTAVNPLHPAANSLMTDSFREHQIVACQHQIRGKKEAAFKIISQQLKCLLSRDATYHRQ